jgi:hypothetical protein
MRGALAVVVVALGLSVATAGVAQEKGKLEAPTIDEKAGTVSFAARPCKTGQYEDKLKGAIEFVIVMPGGKEYESCFVASVDPLKLHAGLQKVGAKPGKPAQDEKTPATGGKLKISVTWKDGDKDRTEPIEKFILDEETKKPMENVQWLYQGSKEGFIPEIGEMGLLVQTTKHVMALYQGEGTPLITNPLPLMTGHRYKANKQILPKEGTVVKIVMEAVK